eukprot:6071013-Amphidinium_carterae.1
MSGQYSWEPIIHSYTLALPHGCLPSVFVNCVRILRHIANSSPGWKTDQHMNCKVFGTIVKSLNNSSTNQYGSVTKRLKPPTP